MNRPSVLLRKIRRNPLVLAGVVIILTFGVVALFASHMAPYDPTERVAVPYVRPCMEHLLGTNDIGQDILSEMIWGTRVSLTIGIVAALISTVVGALLGLLAGYLRGWVDQVLTALIDVMMSLPGLPLTLVLVAFFGGGMGNMIFVICLTAWVGTARVVRARVIQLREEPFIKIEQAMGAGAFRVMAVHLLPNVSDILLTRFALSVGSAMMTESSLSFLGLGSYGEKSWGNVLHYAFYRGGLLRGFYWWYLPPILCISLCMLGFMLLTQQGHNREGFGKVRTKETRHA